MYVQAMLYFVI